MSDRIEVFGKLPNSVYVAVSGGADSMAILDFLVSGRRDVVVLHYDHGTKYGAMARILVESYCEKRAIKYFTGCIEDFRKQLPSESPEMYWRAARYSFFDKFTDRPIITGHHLDDQVENFIMSSFRTGTIKFIPYKRGNYLRPFILTRSYQFKKWCARKSVPFIDDPGNESDKYMRSYIRTNIMPHALKVNPGLYKTVKRKLLEDLNN